MLNWELIRHPMNWLTIILMTVIGMMALDILLQPFAKAHGNGDNSGE